MHRYHLIIPNSDSMEFNLILKGNSKEIYVQSIKDSTEHWSLQDALLFYTLNKTFYSDLLQSQLRSFLIGFVALFCKLDTT